MTLRRSDVAVALCTDTLGVIEATEEAPLGGD